MRQLPVELDQTAAAGTAPQGQSAGGGRGIADGVKKDPGLLGRGRGGLTSPVDRRKALEILDAGMAAGARSCELATLLGVGLSTLQRWRRQFAEDGDSSDGRKGSHRLVSHRLSEEERLTRPWQHVLEPLSGYLCLAERLCAGASLADALHFGPQLQANNSMRELEEEALRHWPGTWIDQNDPKAPHEASLLNLLIDKAHHQLGWAARWDFATTLAPRGLVPARGGRAGLSAGELPGRSGEPCGHAHPLMGACCCAA